VPSIGPSFGVRSGDRAAPSSPAIDYPLAASNAGFHHLNATLLQPLGIDHERLTDRLQGRDYRLTDVHGKVVKEIIA
jgi:hypothetical protein